MGKLDGKVALITGGASGIGRAIAELFASEGAAIGILDLDGEKAERAATELASGHSAETASAEADVSDEVAVEAAIGRIVDALGAIDILVNNAGIDTTCPVETMPSDLWDRMIAVHLKGTFVCTRAVLPAMRRKRWGRIISLSSQLAHKGAPTIASKMALIHPPTAKKK